MKGKHTFLLCFLILLDFVAKAQIYPNGDFESGSNGACDCVTGYTCNNDAERVVDGIHPLYTILNDGCVTDNMNYINPLGAHGGTGYVYFYAGFDNRTTPNSNFNGGEKIELCVWYAGPQGQGDIEQNTTNAHFLFGVNDVQVGPDVLVPTRTGTDSRTYLW